MKLFATLVIGGIVALMLLALPIALLVAIAIGTIQGFSR